MFLNFSKHPYTILQNWLCIEGFLNRKRYFIKISHIFQQTNGVTAHNCLAILQSVNGQLLNRLHNLVIVDLLNSLTDRLNVLQIIVHQDFMQQLEALLDLRVGRFQLKNYARNLIIEFEVHYWVWYSWHIWLLRNMVKNLKIGKQHIMTGLLTYL